MRNLVIPTPGQILRLNPGRLNRTPEAIRWLLGEQARRMDAGEHPLIAGAASFSDYAEKAVLEHITGRAEFAKPTFYLALCTVVPEDGKTGATITEANYTGYARLKLEASAWAEAAGGAIANDEVLEFAECTAGESTIIGWAGCDASGTGEGNMLAWGTCESTTISTTQTPPTVATSKLEITLD